MVVWFTVLSYAIVVIIMANRKKNVRRNEIIPSDKLLEVYFEDSGSEIEPSDSEDESPAFTPVSTPASTSASTPVPSRVGSPHLVPEEELTNLEQRESEYLAIDDPDLLLQIQNYEATVSFDLSSSLCVHSLHQFYLQLKYFFL